MNPADAAESIFDAICIGEGEYPTLEIASQLEKGVKPHGIMNLWIKNGNNIEKNSPRDYLPNIDGLPSPDREMWEK